MLYQNLESVRHGTQPVVVFDRGAYPHLVDVTAIPIAIVEFARLSGVFPLLWQDNGAECSPVALTGLLPGGNSLLQMKPTHPAPLLWLAYPFAARLVQDQPSMANLLLDHASTAAHATAEPIFDGRGGLTPLAERCVEALRLACADSERTRTVTRAMADAGLLQPWRGALRFRDGDVALAGLLACVPDAEERAASQGLVARFGLVIPWLIELHRASLHRLQGLAATVSARRTAS
jgi:hypothetical protein